MYWAEERLGSERIKTAYAYQDLLKQNGWVALESFINSIKFSAISA